MDSEDHPLNILQQNKNFCEQVGLKKYVGRTKEGQNDMDGSAQEVA